MLLFYIRTDVWKLNRSFMSMKDAILYQSRLKKQYPKLNNILLKNGVKQ